MTLILVNALVNLFISAGTFSMDCFWCQNTFFNLSDYLIHLRCHTGEVDHDIPCPCCKKVLNGYNKFRCHLRRSHSDKTHVCCVCKKGFPTPDKLKNHLLCHSTFAEFLCTFCGKKFKRRDKLREHLTRIHLSQKEGKYQSLKVKAPRCKRCTIPKLSADEVDKFAYKCTRCGVGFNRRGILVNHLARLHPEVAINSEPQLSLPIVQPQRVYICPHCHMVYMTNGKRKSHMMRSHPGAEMSSCSRQQDTQHVGFVTIKPHACEWCPRQFLTNAKYLQHQRKHHFSEMAQLTRETPVCSKPGGLRRKSEVEGKHVQSFEEDVQKSEENAE